MAAKSPGPQAATHHATPLTAVALLMTAEHVESQLTFLRTQSMPGTSIIIATSLTTPDCSWPGSKSVALMSVLNKQDYARWHSHTLHVETGTADPALVRRNCRSETCCRACGLLRALYKDYVGW